MQVVPNMDKIHIVIMGCLLILLHPNGVWIFPWSSRESLYTGHHRTISISCGHCFAVLCCLSWQAYLSYGVQANLNCFTVNFTKWSFYCHELNTYYCITVQLWLFTNICYWFVLKWLVLDVNFFSIGLWLACFFHTGI